MERQFKDVRDLGDDLFVHYCLIDNGSSYEHVLEGVVDWPFESIDIFISYFIKIEVSHEEYRVSKEELTEKETQEVEKGSFAAASRCEVWEYKDYHINTNRSNKNIKEHILVRSGLECFIEEIVICFNKQQTIVQESCLQ